MLGRLTAAAQAALLALEPERAHEAALRALEAGIHPRGTADDARLATAAFGLRFANPLGMAAGFDKGARATTALGRIGFGHVEIGTVTPRPQPGNPRPRIFRLPADEALINRLGFNSEGHEAVAQRLGRRRAAGGVIVGVNLGANRESRDPVTGYVAGLARFWLLADYFTVNISSPNTPGLRDLQAPAQLDALLVRLMAEREAQLARGAPRRAILVKLAPDLAADDLPAIVERIVQHGVDGIVLTNTTIARNGIAGGSIGREAGGLSGAPLFTRSTIMLARVYRLTGGRVPLVGVGGIDSGAAAVAKLEAGATLLQLYTALVYRGAGLVADIKRALVERAAAAGVGSVAGLVGRDAGRWV